jgi:hypothetical protein
MILMVIDHTRDFFGNAALLRRDFFVTIFGDPAL